MSSRADRVGANLAERELDALLVTNMANVRWLSGFTGTNAACLVAADRRLFFTDFRYVSQAGEQVHDFELVRSRPDLLGTVAEEMSGRVGFEDASLSVRSHAKLQEAAPDGVELVAASGLVEDLREVKDGRELDAIRAAASISDRVFEELAERGVGDRTERRIAFELEVRMRELGADDRSFPAIVASGAHAALPHAAPRDRPVELGALLIVDMGCVVDGYCSDCTRTFATGQLDSEAQAIYKLVLDAQQAALAAVAPGAARRAVDGVARGIIDAAGHAEHFGHGLGHGVGLEVHEGPRLAQTAEGGLAAGNVVTVEPGVYLPERFGVRIEDLVAVTGEGCERLTRFTKELVTLS
jgi:Xaa-Pro aminopeptidase